MSNKVKSRVKIKINAKKLSDFKGFQINEKKFKIPYSIDWECPNCGENHSNVLNDDEYLSFPKINAPIKYILYCDECENQGKDCEWKIKIQLNLSIDVIDNEGIALNIN